MNIHPVILFNEIDGFVRDAKSNQTEEVHFQQFHLFTFWALNFCSPHHVIAIWIFHSNLWHVCNNRFIGNQDTACMNTAVCDDSFDPFCRINDELLFGVLFSFDHRGIDFFRLCDCDLRCCRDVSGKLVSKGDRLAEHSCDDLQRVLCCSCAKGDNARYMICPILDSAILDDLFSAGIFKVGINIRHADTIR